MNEEIELVEQDYSPINKEGDEVGINMESYLKYSGTPIREICESIQVFNLGIHILRLLKQNLAQGLGAIFGLYADCFVSMSLFLFLDESILNTSSYPKTDWTKFPSFRASP
ncbi:unnamed protein product [Lepeophtheirus salmonis]|uniref:(salmon louse) hypothetical protein n=1 Tax=Lepeophtheirus salmonis TaxID=72036 RepID=A0A7R8HA36_LEPSM|nr:unnamed protein product [Lepeophtheirus salmonis]CAF2970398.1 unnamed protein product [Lepeophtheirus salmonis]